MRAVNAYNAVLPLAGLLFLGLLLPGCFFRRAEDPQATPAGVVEAFFKAFQEKDLETMLHLHQEQNVGLEERDFLGRLIELIELKSISVSEVELLAPDEALVSVEITMALFGRESTGKSAYRVVCRDGRWSFGGEPAFP